MNDLLNKYKNNFHVEAIDELIEFANKLKALESNEDLSFEGEISANRRNMSYEIHMSQETIDAHRTVRQFILSIKNFVM